MKKTIKLKWLSVAVLSLLLGFCALCLCIGAPTNVNASAETVKTFYTSTELGINGKTPITYSAFVTSSGVTLDENDVGFKMEKGASVRVSDITPGIRYQVNLGAGINTIKSGDKYNENTYTYDHYVLFNTGNSYLFVKSELKNNGDDFYYTAAITFDNVDDANFNDYKALEINGQGVMVVSNGSEKIVVLADENDNVRTMESVVNTAKFKGALDDYAEHTIAVMDKFAPGDKDTYNYKAGKIYAEKTGITATDIASDIGVEGAKAIYHETKKISLSDLDFSSVAVGEKAEGYLAVVNADGKFMNVPYLVADKVIRTENDLSCVYSNLAATSSENVVIEDYVVVANDIKHTSFSANPAYTNNASVYYNRGFGGTFDGQGHTVEYGIQSGGLFGVLYEATIKDTAFIVKERTNIAGSGWIQSKNTILARFAKFSTIENVYAKYDGTSLQTLTAGSVGSSSGIGLVSASTGGTYTNVVLDYTGIANADAIKGNYTSGLPNYAQNGFGAFASPAHSSWESPASTTNVFVYWDVKEIFASPVRGMVHVAENDYDAYSTAMSGTGYENTVYGTYTLGKFEGTNRFDDYDGAKTYFADKAELLTKFSSFTDTSYGFPFVGTAPEEWTTDLGKAYYDGDTSDHDADKAIVLPQGLDITAVTSIVDSDNGTEYFDGSSWNIDASNTATTLTAAKTLNVKVLGANGMLIGKMQIVCATKVISTAEDLKSVYYKGDEATTVTGYFIVANNIDYDPNVVIEPTGYTNGASGSKFSGVFDGNGKTINYAVTKGGLFGQLAGTVKNASFIVKAVGTKDYASNVILAGYAVNYSKVENVYAKYDFEFTPDLSYVASGVYRNAGLGLFEGSNVPDLKNVILDLSNVTLDGAHGTTNVRNYGVLGCPSSGGWYYGTYSNCHVIWTVKELHFYNATTSINKVAVATGDTAETTYNEMNVSASQVLTGVTRYDNVSAMNGTTVGNFTVTDGTVTWND